MLSHTEIEILQLLGVPKIHVGFSFDDLKEKPAITGEVLALGDGTIFCWDGVWQKMGNLQEEYIDHIAPRIKKILDTKFVGITLSEFVSMLLRKGSPAVHHEKEFPPDVSFQLPHGTINITGPVVDCWDACERKWQQIFDFRSFTGKRDSCLIALQRLEDILKKQKTAGAFVKEGALPLASEEPPMRVKSGILDQMRKALARSGPFTIAEKSTLEKLIEEKATEDGTSGEVTITTGTDTGETVVKESRLQDRISWANAPPSDPVEGDFWFSTTESSTYVRKGDEWVLLDGTGEEPLCLKPKVGRTIPDLSSPPVLSSGSLGTFTENPPAGRESVKQRTKEELDRIKFEELAEKRRKRSEW